MVYLFTWFLFLHEAATQGLKVSIYWKSGQKLSMSIRF